MASFIYEVAFKINLKDFYYTYLGGESLKRFTSVHDPSPLIFHSLSFIRGRKKERDGSWTLVNYF